MSVCVCDRCRSGDHSRCRGWAYYAPTLDLIACECQACAVTADTHEEPA